MNREERRALELEQANLYSLYQGMSGMLAASEDYYNEGMLIWLDADTLIRELSKGKRSLDDFARGFFGIEDGRWSPVTYTFENVVAALNAVQPYDWAKFLRARLDEVSADREELVLDGLVGERLLQRAFEHCDHLRRSLRRREDANIARGGEILHTAFDHRRNLRRLRRALRRAEGDDAHLAGLVMRQHGVDLHHRARDVAGKQIRHERATAAIRHVLEFGAGRGGETSERHVRCAAGSRSSDVDLLLLRHRDEIGQRFRRHRRMHRDAIRAGGQQRDGHEVFIQIKTEPAVQADADGVGHAAEHQGMAIRRGLGRDFQRDVATRP